MWPKNEYNLKHGAKSMQNNPSEGYKCYRSVLLKFENRVER